MLRLKIHRTKLRKTKISDDFRWKITTNVIQVFIHRCKSTICLSNFKTLSFADTLINYTSLKVWPKYKTENILDKLYS